MARADYQIEVIIDGKTFSTGGVLSTDDAEVMPETPIIRELALGMRRAAMSYLVRHRGFTGEKAHEATQCMVGGL